jgi:hypothetical protein
VSTARPSLFEVQGDLFVPTEFSRGPWDPQHLHGGAPAALMTGALEALAGPDRSVSRIAVELMRPVPMEPLALSTSVIRGGRKVSIFEATLSVASSNVTVASARGTAIARSPSEPIDRTAPLLGPDEAVDHPSDPSEFGLAFHTDANEIRWESGQWHDPMGARERPVITWIRLRLPVLFDPSDGSTVEPSALQRATAAADFGNGVSAVLSWEDYVFINSDVSVYLWRPPQGEWIGLVASTFVGASGSGVAESEMFDRTGRFGRAVQTVLVEAR